MKILEWGLPTIAAGALMVGAAMNAQAQDTAMPQQQGTGQQMDQNQQYVPPATDTQMGQTPTVPPTTTTPPTTVPPPTTDYGTGGSGTMARDGGTGGYIDYGTGGAGTAGTTEDNLGVDVPNTGSTGTNENTVPNTGNQNTVTPTP